MIKIEIRYTKNYVAKKEVAVMSLPTYLSMEKLNAEVWNKAQNFLVEKYTGKIDLKKIKLLSVKVLS